MLNENVFMDFLVIAHLLAYIFNHGTTVCVDHRLSRLGIFLNPFSLYICNIPAPCLYPHTQLFFGAFALLVEVANENEYLEYIVSRNNVPADTNPPQQVNFLAPLVFDTIILLRKVANVMHDSILRRINNPYKSKCNSTYKVVL